MTKRINNAGVSLIELIVVITILGIMAGVVSGSLGVMSGVDASGAANSLDAKLEQVKTEAMSKNEAALVLYRRDNGYFVACTNAARPFSATPADEQQLGNNQMAITVTLEGGGTIDIGEQAVAIRFDRASGAILPIAFVEAGGMVEQGAGPSQIEITARGRTSRITLVSATGKHYIE